MDDRHDFNGIAFVWNTDKANSNLAKHGVSFEQAAEAFFDPFLRVIDATDNDEARVAIIAMDESWRLLFVVHVEVEEDTVRIISARRAEPIERNIYEN
jgi:uncharacterized DUF497 family protein